MADNQIEERNGRLLTALNRLAKWRSVFAGWQLGTRAKGDPESDAVRDHRELTLLLRVEMNALADLLVRKGIISQEEWQEAVTAEAQRYERDLERRFPGYRATEHGMAMNLEEIQKHGTMKGWRP